MFVVPREQDQCSLYLSWLPIAKRDIDIERDAHM